MREFFAFIIFALCAIAIWHEIKMGRSAADPYPDAPDKSEEEQANE